MLKPPLAAMTVSSSGSDQYNVPLYRAASPQTHWYDIWYEQLS